MWSNLAIGIGKIQYRSTSNHDWGALEQGTEPPTAPRAPQHKWLPTAPGVCSRCVWVFTAVCVHLGWVKCRARIPSMGHHTWSYVTSLSLIHSRDARYTGTGKVPVYIIFQTVRYHNFAQFGISYAAVAKYTCRCQCFPNCCATGKMWQQNNAMDQTDETLSTHPRLINRE